MRVEIETGSKDTQVQCNMPSCVRTHPERGRTLLGVIEHRRPRQMAALVAALVEPLRESVIELLQSCPPKRMPVLYLNF